MTKLRVLDLFSGLGGFSLGLERTEGFETVAFCEIDPFCQKVLKKQWPHVEIIQGVRSVGREQIAALGTVHAITAGFPCQDISYAGDGAGLSGARSGLYREAIRAIRLVRPLYALLENVAALLNRGLGTVLGDVAEIGNDAEWHCIPASAVGAPHLRDRVWIIAHPAVLGRGPLLVNEPSAEASSSGLFAGMDAESVRKLPPETVVCRKGHGVSHRVDRVAALGNAVVPQIPELIGRAILSEQGDPP